MSKSRFKEILSLCDSKKTIPTIELYKDFGCSFHKQLTSIIDEHKKDFLEHGELIYGSSNKGKRGQPNKSYFINSNHFVLLVVLSNKNSKSMKLKYDWVDYMHNMREKIAEAFINGDIE